MAIAPWMQVIIAGMYLIKSIDAITFAKDVSFFPQCGRSWPHETVGYRSSCMYGSCPYEVLAKDKIDLHVL